MVRVGVRVRVSKLLGYTFDYHCLPTVPFTLDVPLYASNCSQFVALFFGVNCGSLKKWAVNLKSIYHKSDSFKA